MKTKFTLFFFAVLLNFSFKAQTYVTIPDPNFELYLQLHFPSCMSGNQMNIDCAEIQNDTLLNVHSWMIADLTGITYFSNLRTLDCSNNQLTFLPELPSTLLTLECYQNNIVNLSNLPPNLTYLSLSYNQLTNLPELPSTLITLKCNNNNLVNIPNLPTNLISIDFSSNQITELPLLPSMLQFLNGDYNQLTILPELPLSLKSLIISGNHLTSLPFLPSTLTILDCNDNELGNLPDLPSNLEILSFEYNQISNISYFPNSLRAIFCTKNLISNLPSLPNNMIGIGCDSNQLVTLPSLPDSLIYFSCRGNNIICFPTFPNLLSDSNWFSISGNPNTCVPNYVSGMDAATLSIPLCQENDLVNNPNNCASLLGISGIVYFDEDLSCNKGTDEIGVKNIPIKVYDQADSLLAQYNSVGSGLYNFLLDTGTYKVKVDTNNLPLRFECQDLDSTFTLTTESPSVSEINFPLTCKAGFDIGTQAVTTSGWVFPGQNHTLNVLAGDMSQWYGLNCATGIGGEVQISVSGPVNYLNPGMYSLEPTIVNNAFSYTIADFGDVDFLHDFALVFQTDTSAQAGDQICISVNLTPEIGDYNAANNQFEFCYSVVNSYDPNMKEVFPVYVEPGFEDYFTYTIHFQNTGSAPAFNIRLLDTLDANLNLETFQVINYSHYNTATVVGNTLTFKFPNILLPDSTTNLEGSKGFVQYRIKPKANLPLGTQLHNTAYIYFDFNAPIVTNTTINELVLNISVDEIAQSSFQIYPNPFSSKTTLKFPKNLNNATLEIRNSIGQLVKSVQDLQEDTYLLDRDNLPAGLYLIQIKEKNSIYKPMKILLK